MDDQLATLTKAEQSRLQKLADEAGCTPRDMLNHVLRDGFEQTEKEVRLIKQRLADSTARPTTPHDQAMAHLERILEKHAEAA